VRRLRTRAVFVAALLGAGACASAWAGSPADLSRGRTIVLTVHHSRFSPSVLRVRRGETVRFVVRNTDPIDHELIVGPMSAQIRHETGRERWHRPVPGEVSVRLLRSASTSYTFAEAGTIWFGCHLPGHWPYGMRGRVIVS
jgi:uncharacterized cupredoxin-like copper-binding protein